MFPLLFEIPIFEGIRIYTYGVLYALAAIIAIYWTIHEGKIAGFRPDTILDLSFYLILSELVGARILYILTDWEKYVANPLDVLKIWEGGLIFYGGFIGAILFGLYYVRRHKLSFLAVADLYMPGLSLGHAVGRLGCFAAGCCYGRETTDRFFSVTFPQNPYSLAPVGIPLFPSQLVESAASLLIFFILIGLRHKKSFDGQVFLAYLFLYSVSRAVFEIFRGVASRVDMIPGLMSTSQFISLCLMAVAIIIYFRLRSIRHRTPLRRGRIT